MATPAAILQVLFEANTRAATTDIRQFDAALDRLDKRTVSATTRTTGLGTASRTTGSRLASAAGYAASAAAAYLSIAQAKAAITTTQDLAKTTAGLNRNLGLSVKTASQWGAVAKSRDVDAKALTMSFTTLSRRLVDTSAALKEGGTAADTAMAPFARLGITQREVTAGSKDLGSFLPRLADAFGDAAGGAERQASAQQLLGRGYQTIVPLFADGAKGLKEQQKWADKYGATLTGDTLKAQMDLIQAQRESKVAMLGMQVVFTQALTPALEKANKVFQRLSAIMADDKLTRAEKFEKIGKIIGKWADKAYDAFIKILPKIISKAGEKAPEIAKALVEGFVNAPILGKLFLGTMLITKLGGWGALMGLGNKMGSKTGTSFASGFKGALAAGGLLIAVQQALTTRGGILDTLAGKGTVSITEKLAGDFKELGEAVRIAIKGKDLQSLEELDHLMQAMAQSSIDSGQKVPKALQKMIDAVNNARGKMGDDLNETSDAFGDFASDVAKAAGVTVPQKVDKAADSVAQGAKRIGDDLDKAGDDSRDFGKRWDNNMRGISRTTANVADAVGQGLDTIGRNTNSLLKGLNVGTLKYSIAKAGKGVMEGASGIHFKQRGGHINMGAPSGDSVPAVLEKGEYVLNRRAVAALGKGNLDAVNFGMAKRFQQGGSVIEQALGPYSIPPIMYDPNHAGGNSHLHLDFYTQAQAIAYGKKMQSMGWNISEYSGPYGGFSGVTVNHQSPGHYDGTAFDANTGSDETQAEVSAVASLLGGKGALGGVIAKVARVLLEGPNDPLRTAGQNALDKVRSAANAYITDKSASAVGGGVNVGPGAVSRTEMRALLKANSLPDIMGWVAGAESNWNPSLVNSIGATGLFQILVSAHPDLNSKYNLLSAGENTAAAATLYRANELQDWAASAHAGGLGGDGGWAQYLGQPFQKGGQAGGHKHKPPPWTDVNGKFNAPGWWQITGPAKYPGFMEMGKAREITEKLAGVTKEIVSAEEIIDIDRRVADADGIFSANEIAGQISLYGQLLGKLIRARDISSHGIDVTDKGLRVAKGPNKRALQEMRSGFNEVLTEMVGATGGGGHIFDTLMDIDALKRTAPDIPEGPAGRGSVLEAIEAAIALAALTPDTLEDDIAGYRQLVHYWTTLLAHLQATGGSYSEIGTAASSLKSAQDTLDDLLRGLEPTKPDTSELDALKYEQALATIRRLNVGIAQNSVFAGTFAAGGSIPSGAWGIAGERGPELVSGPAQVYSNRDSQQMLKPEVRVVIEDNRTRVMVDGKEVEAIVDNKLNRIARGRSYAGAGRL